MKTNRIVVPPLLVILVGFMMLVHSQDVTRLEVATVANTWINTIITKFGSWGGQKLASIASIETLKRGDRDLGYLINVRPVGYIVLSSRKEFIPIRAYSTSGRFDPTSNKGMEDVIKSGAERTIEAIEAKAGSIRKASVQEVQRLFEADNHPMWNSLLTGSILNAANVRSRQKVGDYLEGDWLLTSSWKQTWPYNQKCPTDAACTDSVTNGHTAVGCVATAAAQIMHYYCWPPYGSDSPYDVWYDWVHMPDFLKWNAAGDEIVAVAELCYNVGLSAGMDYGCPESSASMFGSLGKDMLDGYEDHFKYDQDADWALRANHLASGWFDIIKSNINANHPLQYRIPTSWLLGGHSIVCDGWNETGDGRWYHMNYGWGNFYNCWYGLDNLAISNSYLEEAMLTDLKPRGACGTFISGGYSTDDFPYRYFDQSATSDGAEFTAGQRLQFLPGVVLKNNPSSGKKIHFVGWSGEPTNLFTKGDLSRGVHLLSGHFSIYANGGIRFAK